MKTLVSGLLIAGLLAGCSGNTGTTPQVGGSGLVLDGTMRLVSIQRSNDSLGAHRISQVTVSSHGQQLPITVDEVTSTQNANVENVTVTAGSHMIKGVFTQLPSIGKTQITVMVDSKPYVSETRTGLIGQISDAQVATALSNIQKHTQQESSQRHTQGIPLALCWAVCVGGVEIEGPFVLVCLAACQAMSLN